ncbi:hypothetical protein pipiens_015473 [Culex pipiens pipiens]|uniref:Uncharacterized protein n=1 Tax=Culex pipiens pipiens TaxID=38569 RepID=A0ABD1CQF2_CULPP
MLLREARSTWPLPPRPNWPRRVLPLRRGRRLLLPESVPLLSERLRRCKAADAAAKIKKRSAPRTNPGATRATTAKKKGSAGTKKVNHQESHRHHRCQEGHRCQGAEGWINVPSPRWSKDRTVPTKIFADSQPYDITKCSLKKEAAMEKIEENNTLNLLATLAFIVVARFDARVAATRVCRRYAEL